MKTPVSTEAAPSAIGPYSQAIKHQGTLYISGQIGIVPGDKAISSTKISEQIDQVFANLEAILSETDSTLDDIVKLNIYLTDLGHFDLVNKKMTLIFNPPYPARATIEVSGLPKGAIVEIDAIAKCD